MKLEFAFSQYAIEQAGARLFEVEDRFKEQITEDIKGDPTAFFMAVWLDEDDEATVYCGIGEHRSDHYRVEVVKGQLHKSPFPFDPAKHPPIFEGKEFAMPQPVETPSNFLFTEAGNA